MKNGGFTLVESIFAAAIFLVIALGAFEAYRALQVSAAVSHQKLSALDLAIEKLESAKALTYAGVASSSETVIKNGLIFGAGTSVTNIDESVDYKLVEVSVTCENCRNFEPVVITAHFYPDEL
jgi:prepilin-type N-terminal cleavage/methylation domain-containing protein